MSYKIFILFAIFFTTTCSQKINYNEVQSDNIIRENSLSNLNTISGPHKRYRRMVNGKDVTNLENFPYQVAIWLTNNLGERFFCGGSIISNFWILTAAHCLINQRNGEIKVVSINRKIPEFIEKSEDAIHFNAEDIITHEKFDEKHFYNDIALIRLNKSIQFSKIVKPIKLINLKDADKIDDKTITISGWGMTSDEEDAAHDLLQTSNISILPKNECQLVFSILGIAIGFTNTSTMICANNNLNTGICEGDSGGAAVAQLNGIPTQIGINSFMVNDQFSQCERVYARMFTRVSSHLDWICEKSGICSE